MYAIRSYYGVHKTADFLVYDAGGIFGIIPALADILSQKNLVIILGIGQA